MEYYEGLEKNRIFLYVALIVVSIADFITTTIGLNAGGIEQNPSMISYVNDPLIFALIKIVAFLGVYLLFEHLIIPYLKNRDEYGVIVQILIYIGLSIGILITLIPVINNILIINMLML